MTQARLGPEVKWAWSMRFAMGAAASDGDPVPSEGDKGRADDVVDDTPGGAILISVKEESKLQWR